MDLSRIEDSQIGGQIRMELNLRRELSFPEHRLVEQWHATAFFAEDSDDTDGQGHVIGHVHAVKCRLGEPQVFDILDSLEADLHTVSSAVIDPASGDLNEAVEDAVEGFGQDFLILNRVHMVKGWRGRGIGRWFAAEVIDSLSPGAAFAATYPAPMDDSQGLVRKKAEAKLRSVWSDIGFQTLSGDVMILDLNLMTFEDRIRASRRKFGVD